MNGDYLFDKTGICQQQKYRDAEPRIWDTPYPTRFPESHTKARILCRRCPALEQCEEYLSGLELLGVHVSGVIAARYSDVGVASEGVIYRQEKCLGCGEQMMPQRRATNSKRSHKGEGLCTECYPRFSRGQLRKEKQ